MTELAAKIEAYDRGMLCDALSRVRDVHENAELCIGVLAGERTTVVALDSSGRAQPSAEEESAKRGPLGCVAKALTGTLALIAAAEGRIDFACGLTETDDPLLYSWIRDTTVRQLLSHTHGLDASHIKRIAQTSAGRIDVRALSDSLREARRLFEPGALYSYSNAGPWLVAALLEKVYSARFADLLVARVLGPAGIEIDIDREPYWCPSMGGDLHLSVPELLRFFRWFFRQHDLCRHAELDVSVPPPGWCLERGSCAGWKYYGSGWYGHNMAVRKQSLFVCAQFEEGIAIVVSAREAPTDTAGMTLLRVFGRLLPQFVGMRIPKALEVPMEISDTAERVGAYGNQAITIRISSDEQSGLRAEVFRDGAAERCDALKPGTDGTYLLESLPLQFIPNGNSGYTHLWNGREVLRRV